MFNELKVAANARAAELPREKITVTLPNGKAFEGVSNQTTPFEIAKGISNSLAKKVRTRYYVILDRYVHLFVIILVFLFLPSAITCSSTRSVFTSTITFSNTTSSGGSIGWSKTVG